MKTALVIMAAGIGSRFGGGIKQLESFGPNGEIIMDYSIHDALKAGFEKVVFIIRHDLEEDFRRIIGNRIEKLTEVEYAFQELSDLPEGFSVPEGRKKPWGTGHAILSARDVIKEPFLIINADDYYGKEAFGKVREFLTTTKEDRSVEPICLAGFELGKTLSKNGGVTRGVCLTDESGTLIGIRETHNIVMTEDGAGEQTDEGIVPLDPKGPVSMNMWGMFPGFLEELKEGFPKFFASLDGNGEKSEYLLPMVVDGMMKAGRAKVQILPTSDSWFGVTYKEDIPGVKEAFRELIANGVYESPLF